MSNDYKIDIDLFNQLAKTIRYDHSKKQKDVLQFMEELPSKLRLELAMVIHKSMYSNITYFLDKDKSFIAWISRQIRPMNVDDQDYIYKEGEEVLEIFFLVDGQAGFVLPRFENKAYLNIVKGDHFGHIDLGDEPEFADNEDINSYLRYKLTHAKKSVHRKFTVQAFENCDLLSLSLQGLHQLRLEFPTAYADIFEGVK